MHYYYLRKLFVLIQSCPLCAYLCIMQRCAVPLTCESGSIRVNQHSHPSLKFVNCTWMSSRVWWEKWKTNRSWYHTWYFKDPLIFNGSLMTSAFWCQNILELLHLKCSAASISGSGSLIGSASFVQYYRNDISRRKLKRKT